MDGSLAPGSPIRQEKLAASLGVSRMPVREALKALETEGLVTHIRNCGFTVATISDSDLEQIYIMRRHLETELLKSVVIPASAAKHLRAANKQFAKAAVAGDVNGVLRTNRAFHFEIFGWSSKTRILEEVVRLWDISEFHRSLFAYVSYAMDEGVRSQIVREHDLIIDAVESGTTRDLIRTMEAHRASSEDRLISRLRDGELPAIGGRMRAPVGNPASSARSRG